MSSSHIKYASLRFTRASHASSISDIFFVSSLPTLLPVQPVNPYPFTVERMRTLVGAQYIRNGNRYDRHPTRVSCVHACTQSAIATPLSSHARAHSFSHAAVTFGARYARARAPIASDTHARTKKNACHLPGAHAVAYRRTSEYIYARMCSRPGGVVPNDRAQTIAHSHTLTHTHTLTHAHARAG